MEFEENSENQTVLQVAMSRVQTPEICNRKVSETNHNPVLLLFSKLE